MRFRTTMTQLLQLNPRSDNVAYAL